MKTEFLQLILLDADISLKERVATYYDKKDDRYYTLGNNNKFIALVSTLKDAKDMHALITYNHITRVHEERRENYRVSLIAVDRSTDFSVEVLTYYHFRQKYLTFIRINKILMEDLSDLTRYPFSKRTHFSQTLKKR